MQARDRSSSKIISRTGETGATLVEYALLLGLVALLAIGAVRQTGQRSKATFQTAALFGSTTSTPTAGRAHSTHGYSGETNEVVLVR